MSLALAYNLRHLIARRLTVGLTLGGIALVVFVYTATMMLSAGLRETLSATGRFDNVIVIRNGAQNEIQSGITREHAGVILSDPAVMRLTDGEPLATRDVVVLVSLRKRRDGEPSNVNVRGVSPLGLEVKEGIRIIAGRRPAPGTREVMVGRSINEKFSGTDLGQAVRLVGTDWVVTGIFDAGNSAFSSEIWGDVEILMPSFRRDRFSSLTFRLAPGADFEALRARLEEDPRLTVTVKREQSFYEDQSKALSMFIRILGTFVSVIFSIGAIVGAMITMYSAVANRVREIGVLRALGFSSWTIFAAFVKECVLMGVLGGFAGVLLAASLSIGRISTTNFNTFSEVAFGFTLTPTIAAQGIIFGAVMGLIGGALPALRAARIKLLEALRA